LNHLACVSLQFLHRLILQARELGPGRAALGHGDRRGADARSTALHYPSTGWVKKMRTGKNKYSNDSHRL